MQHDLFIRELINSYLEEEALVLALPPRPSTLLYPWAIGNKLSNILGWKILRMKQ
jgi:hypothetical protein